MGKKYIERLSQGKEEIAGVYREEREGVGLTERINPYEMSRIGGRMSFEYDPMMQFYEQERQGAENIFELAKDGYKLIFWFSPAGGDYIDGRLVVARVRKTEGDDVWLECRGLVMPHKTERLVAMAEKIMDEGGVSMDPINDSEDLRSQPIGININEDWCEFGERMIGMKKVWQAIRGGEDIKGKRRIEAVVVEVEAELKRRGQIENVYLFEKMMAMRGYALNPMGNHGGSNYAGETGGWFNRFFNNESLVVSRSDERLKLCENCGKYFMKKKGVCPICKK